MVHHLVLSLQLESFCVSNKFSFIHSADFPSHSETIDKDQQHNVDTQLDREESLWCDNLSSGKGDGRLDYSAQL